VIGLVAYSPAVSKRPTSTPDVAATLQTLGNARREPGAAGGRVGAEPRLPITAADLASRRVAERAKAPRGATESTHVEEPSSAHTGSGSAEPIQFACAGACACHDCGSAEHTDERLRSAGIQREVASDAGPLRIAPHSVQARLTRGEPLPAHSAERFSAAYGHDLSGVRVHKESSLARDLGARAFTRGRDVAFAPGEYRPGTASGDQLLAHELAHVVQQSAAPQTSGTSVVQGAGLGVDSYEREADRAAATALSGGRVRAFSSVPNGPIQRKGDDEEKGVFDSIKEGVSDVAGQVKEAALDEVRKYWPGLAELIENPLEFVKKRVVSALESWASGVLGVDTEAVVTEASSLFKNLGDLATSKVGGEKSCLAFAGAIENIKNLYELIANSGVVKSIQSIVSGIQGGIKQVDQLLLAEGFEALKKIAGGVFETLSSAAEQVGKWISAAKEQLGRVWDEIAKRLGFSDGDGILDYLKGKAGEAWGKIKETLGPVAATVAKVLGVFALMNPAGWTIALFKYGPEVIKWAKWLWKNKDEKDLVVKARAEMGDTLPQIIEAVTGLGTGIKDAAKNLKQGIGSVVEAVLGFAEELTDLPILSAAKSVVDTLGKGLKSLATSIGEGFEKAAKTVESVAGTVKGAIQPVIDVLVKVGMAIANPTSIPLMLAGAAWKKFPDCYKPPLIDFLFDLVLAALQSSVANKIFGPLWPVLKPGLVGFVKQLRRMDAQIKIDATNKIATFLSGGSPAFILGFAKGFLTGIWEGISGPIVDLWDVGVALTKLQDWLTGLVVSALTGEPQTPTAAKLATASPAAPPPPTAPVPSTGTATISARPATARIESRAQSPSAGVTQGTIERRGGTEPAPSEGVSHETIERRAGSEPASAPPAATRVAAGEIRAVSGPEAQEGSAAPQVSSGQAEASAESDLPKPDAEGVVDVSRATLDRYRPKEETEESVPKGGTKPPPISQEQFGAEASGLANEVKPSIATVVKDSAAALKEYFNGGKGMTFDELVAKLGEAWASAQALISGEGARMAREAVAVLLGRGGDGIVGEKIGWLAGTISLEVILAVVTAGASEGVSAASKALKIFNKIMNWTDEVFGVLMKGLRKAGSALTSLGGKLFKMAEKSPALKRVTTALKDIGSAVVRFVEKLFGKASHAPGVHPPMPHGSVPHGTPHHGPQPHTAPQPHATPQPQPHTNPPPEAPHAKPDAPAAREPHAQQGTPEAPATHEPHTDTPAKRDASVKDSVKVESKDLTPAQVDAELGHIADNPHLVQGTAPNRKVELGGHTWTEKDGRWCRHSNGEICSVHGPPGLDAKAPAPGAGRDKKPAVETKPEADAGSPKKQPAAEAGAPAHEATPDVAPAKPTAASEMGGASGKKWDDHTLTADEFLADYKKRFPETNLSDDQLRKHFADGGRLNPEKHWKDPTITADEFIADYKKRYPNTSLSDADLAKHHAAGGRLNPETGRIKNPAPGVPEPDVTAKYRGDEVQIDVASMNKKEKRKLDTLLEERDRARARRDALAETNPNSPEWKQAHTDVIKASEGIGDLGAAVSVRKQFPGPPPPLRIDPGAGAGAGEFDQVWRVTDKDGVERLVVVEAKGGSSTLGSRMTDGGLRAQQGTREYFESIINVLENSENEALRKLASELKGLDPVAGIRYLHARAPITKDAAGRSVSDLILVREFDILGKS
jgi:phage-related protein